MNKNVTNGNKMVMEIINKGGKEYHLFVVLFGQTNIYYYFMLHAVQDSIDHYMNLPNEFISLLQIEWFPSDRESTKRQLERQAGGYVTS